LFFHSTAPSLVSTLSLHDALPIYPLVTPRNGTGIGKIIFPIKPCIANYGGNGNGKQFVRRQQFGEIILKSCTEKAQFDIILKLEDRKSTRLNSSHVKISYAVFCLK